MQSVVMIVMICDDDAVSGDDCDDEHSVATDDLSSTY